MRRFEPVAGLGGIVLAVALFLPWYRDATSEFTAWQAFSVIDVLLLVLALLAVAVPVLSIAAREPAKPIAGAVLAAAFGWIAVALVAFRLADPPGPNEFSELEYGAWLGLAGAVIAWIGSWMSLRDESTPGAVAPDVPRRPAPPATSP